MSSELEEIRKDIKTLIGNVSALGQKVEDLNIPTQPCSFFSNHVENFHKNTLIDQIKKQAINVIVSVVIVGLLGYIYLGFKQEAKADTAQTVKKGP